MRLLDSLAQRLIREGRQRTFLLPPRCLPTGGGIVGNRRAASNPTASLGETPAAYLPIQEGRLDFFRQGFHETAIWSIWSRLPHVLVEAGDDQTQSRTVGTGCSRNLPHVHGSFFPAPSPKPLNHSIEGMGFDHMVVAHRGLHHCRERTPFAALVFIRRLSEV